jgi:hypothetical protein
MNDRTPSSSTAEPLEDVGPRPAILEKLVTSPRAFGRIRIFSVGNIADRATLVGRNVEEHPHLDATIDMVALIVTPESVQRS